MGGQDRILSLQYNINQTRDINKEKYQFWG